MAAPIERQQVERWLAEGRSLRQIAQRLGLSWTTFWRQWQRLQHEATPPVHGEVIELPARPGPPPVDASPPEAHRALPAELQAIQQDLLDMVAWWRERQLRRVHPEGHLRSTERWTVHVDMRWIEAVKQEAAAEGVSIMEIVDRAFRHYFERR